MFIENQSPEVTSQARYRRLIGWMTLIALTLAAIELTYAPLAGGASALAALGLLVLWWRPGRRFDTRDRWSKFFTLSAASAIAIATGLLAVESAVRHAYSDVTRTPERDSWFSRRWLDDYPLHFNRLGFREREFAASPEPGTVRVIVMGDSVTFGEGVRTEERFTNVLSERLAASGGRFEILNFGDSGASLRDHLDSLARIVLPAQPQVVLLQWYVDDVRPGPPPALQHSQLVPSKSLHRFLHHHSASYYLLERWWRRLRRENDLAAKSPYLRAIPTSEDVLRAHTERIRSLVRTIEASGAVAQIVVFPALVEVGGNPQRYPYRQSMDGVLAACAELGIDCLDLRPLFAAVEPASALWANRLFIHPGARANAIAAAAIAERLASRWPVR